MIERIRRVVEYFSSWRRYCALLAAVFVLRGLFLLSVLPPFEGWDEYQHIAYIVFFLENGQSPTLNEDNVVPRSMYPELVKYPHAEMATAQLRSIGAESYESFWSRGVAPEVAAGAPDLPLYQAQHSSFYYRLVSPLYRWTASNWGILGGLTALRLLNVLFGGAAIYIALRSLKRIISADAHRYLPAILIAWQPLFLMNCARVANDAFAVLLGTIAIALLLVLGPRHFLRGSIGAGLALGLGILSKTINLGLLPFAVFVFASLAWQRRIHYKRALLGCTLFLVAVVVVTLPYFWSNVSRFGMLTPMQEAVKNRSDGRTGADFLRAASEIDWFREISRRYLRHSLWRGGWSWLSAPSVLIKAHQYTILAAMLGGCFLFGRGARRRRWIFGDRGTASRIAVLWAGMTLGLCYHMLHTHVTLSAVATNIWYAAVTFPWLLCVFYQGIAGYPRRWATYGFAFSMLFIFVTTEIYGTAVEMVRVYAATTSPGMAWERLAGIHPAWLGPPTAAAALMVVLALSGVAVAVGIRATRLCDRRHGAAE